jgi:hypothetical protein
VCYRVPVLHRAGNGVVLFVLGCRPEAIPVEPSTQSGPMMPDLPSSVPAPSSPEGALTAAVTRYGPTVEEIDRIRGADGQTLLLYSYDALDAWLHEPAQTRRAGELRAEIAQAVLRCQKERDTERRADYDPDDIHDPCEKVAAESLDPSLRRAHGCQLARAIWIGPLDVLEYDLTPGIPRPRQEPERTCMGAVEVEQDDLLGIGEPLIVIYYDHNQPNAAAFQSDYDVFYSEVLVLDPLDGREVLGFQRYASTGTTYSSSVERKLERGTDGGLMMWALSTDEAEQEACHGNHDDDNHGADGCDGARWELEHRFVWDPANRELVGVD